MDFHKHALILAMIGSLRQRGSRTSKVHIIKGLFLAKAAGLFDVPLEFFLYKHGPYSTEVEANIEEMKSYAAVEVEPAFDGYGVILTGGQNASFPAGHGPLSVEEQAGIDRVCEFLRGRNAVELERLATAAWIRTHEGITDADAVAERLHALKPHVSLREARLADQTVQQFLATDPANP